MKITRLINSGKATGLKLGKLISFDSYLTSEILKFCNSAAFSFNQKITSISHAVMLLGFSKVSAISSMLFMRKQYEIKDNKSPQYTIWLHSIGVAHGAEFLNIKLNNAANYSGFTAGLLIDVGKTAILKAMEDKMPEIVQDYLQNSILCEYPSEALEYENEMLGFNHVEIGSELLAIWDMPESLQHAIKHHHDEEKAQECNSTKALYLSDLLTYKRQSITDSFLNVISEDFSVREDLLKSTLYEINSSIENIAK